MFARRAVAKHTVLRLTLALFVMLMSGILGACGGTSTSPSGPVELTYTYPGVVPKDVQAVQDAMNVILKQKMNATIKLIPIDWGAFDQKMKLGFAAGQPCDVVFTAPWTNNYYQNVTNGNLLALDDLLPRLAPNLYKSMPASTWAAARVNGKIYGVLNQQIFVQTWGVYVRKDLADKYKLDLTSVNTFKDIEPFLATLKAKEPGITPIYDAQTFTGDITSPQNAGIDIVDGGVGLAAVRADDTTHKVFNILDDPDYQQQIALEHQWYTKGYYPKDQPADAEAQAAFKAGKYGVIFHTYKPGGEIEFANQFGQNFVSKPLGQNILTTSSVVATMNGICRTSQHPEQAMQFLELINTNKDLYNLLAKGVEGKHWKWVDKAQNVIGFPDGVTSATSGYNPNTDWMFGNQFNAYYIDKAQIGDWDATLKLNQTATPSAALGFSMDTSKVKTLVAQLTSVAKQFNLKREDPATALPKYKDALKAAGLDQFITEVQNQVNAWAQANKK